MCQSCVSFLHIGLVVFIYFEKLLNYFFLTYFRKQIRRVPLSLSANADSGVCQRDVLRDNRDTDYQNPAGDFRSAPWGFEAPLQAGQ